MANIIGNNPDLWAKNQVDLRQQLLGLKNKSPEMLSWQTNKTAWIRAISAVTVTDEKARELTERENFGGGKLAQEYVLFNGTVGLEQQTDKDGNITYDQKTNAGVYNGQQPNNSAYGFEYDSERGLVPMPGISDLTISTYNRGSLRRASFKVKAYNRKQFAALDALFMRPGYTLLIEWGHTTYYTGTPEKPKYNTANFNTKPFLLLNEFLEGKGGGSQDNILKAIKRERGNGLTSEFDQNGEDSGFTEGNYDGFYGKITNFVWSLNPDGSYNIEVKAISTGDIIESLTIDHVTSVVNSTPEKFPPSQSSYSDDNAFEYISCYKGKGKNKIEWEAKVKNKKQYLEYWRNRFNEESNGTGTFDQFRLNPIATNTSYADEVKQFKKALAKYPSTMSSFTLKPPANQVSPEEPGPDVLLTNRDRSRLNKFLYDNYNFLKKNFNKYDEKVKTSTKDNRTIRVFSTLTVSDDDDRRLIANQDLVMIQPLVQREVTDGITGNSLGGKYYLSKNAPYQYMSLRKLLKFIEDELLIYNGGDLKDPNAAKTEAEKIAIIASNQLILDTQTKQLINQNNKIAGITDESKYFKLDKILNFDLDGENYMYTQPTQFSADPNVCLIPFVFPASSDPDDIPGYFFNVLKGCGFRLKESEYVASILNIPVNIHYIGKVLQQVTSNNSVPLLKFLEQIMYGIQEALGSINKFSVTYNHDENEIVFRDDVPLDPKVATKTKVPPDQRMLFNVNGFKSKLENASFINNVSMTTTLSNKFATMISIGAQAQSTSDVVDSTSFSRWNEGLKDSVTPSKLSKTGLQSTVKQASEPNKLFKNSIISLNKPSALIPSFYSKGIMPSGDVQSTAQSLNSNFNKYTKTTFTKLQTPSSQGFIPFSMNLDMDGFSGLRIYEKFYITTEILPPSYPKTLSFICKGLTHTVNTNGWKTKIDSLTITSVDDDDDLVIKKNVVKNNLQNSRL